MLTIVITAAVQLILFVLGAIVVRKKTKAETENLVVQQYDKLATQYREEINRLTESMKRLEEKYKVLQLDHEACEYDHMVKTLELAQVKKIIDLNSLPKASVFVLDDNRLTVMEFKKYFGSISVLDCKTFLVAAEFLAAAQKEQPEILILDYFLSDTMTAEDVIKDLGYVPEIFIMSQDKSIHVKVREKGLEFFYKDDHYVAKIARAVIEYLYHKT